MMPLNKTKELAQVVDESILPLEHSGGDGWTILHGDTLQIIRAFKPQVFDALITDPPYASGGWKPSEKNRTTNQKYSSMNPKNALPDFDGDNRDQRSWTRWMAEWLSDARKACRPGAPVCLFIDWRQYPSITDALQWAGWIWRGCVVWDKMTASSFSLICVIFIYFLNYLYIFFKDRHKKKRMQPFQQLLFKVYPFLFNFV